MAERQSELKDDIEQEQSILAELKKCVQTFKLLTAKHSCFHRRREQLQRDVEMLTKDKLKLETTVEELRKQELTHRKELENTLNQIQESKAVLVQTTDELKTAEEQLKSVNTQTLGHVSYCYFMSMIMFSFSGWQ